MPRKRKIRRRGRRRWRRKSRFWKPIINHKGPWAQTAVARLKYNQSVSINPGAAGTAAANVFRANSIFDPDYTGVGHQPLGTDEWFTMYQHATIIGSKITARFVATSTTETNICGIALTSTTGISTAAGHLMEKRDSYYKVLGTINGKNTVTVVNKYSPKKYFGYRNPMSLGNLRHTDSTNPSEDVLFQVYVAPADLSSDNSAIVANITIEYIVVFAEPTQPGQS